MKQKIAISLDQTLLDTIDRRVDGGIIRSRSSAIEYFLKKGLAEETINTAVILLKGSHQQVALKKINNETLISLQLQFLAQNGFTQCFIVTSHTKLITNLLDEVSKAKINTNIIEKETQGNAQALLAIKEYVTSDFIVLSGDVYSTFNYQSMLEKHKREGRTCTMGLMSREKAAEYGNVILDGDLIIDFIEKPKKIESHVVNAGIYLCSPRIFEHIHKLNSLEKDVFPQLSKKKELVGYFTHGTYQHVS